MESIQIDSGTVRLCINGDESRVIEFDPTDMLFAERFYHILGDAETRMSEFQEQVRELGDADPEKLIGMSIAVGKYMREKIDEAFGPETSQTVFGKAINPVAFLNFLTAVGAYFETARRARIEPYIPHVQKPSGKGRKSRKR